jgi:5-hydroxyisourate hydrolase-like protein (transthyretin family)
MARIVPLESGARGEDAANLIAAMITLLGRDAIQLNAAEKALVMAQLLQERTSKSFGAGTRRVVELFQRAHQLEPSGRVDERTAKFINDLLDAIGGPAGSAEVPLAQQFAAAGLVRMDSGQPVPNRHVRASHAGDRAAVLLGESSTDADGRYTIRYDPLPGVDTIRLRLSILGEDGNVVHEVDGPAAARALEVVDITIPAAAPAPAEGRVDGRIVLEHGQPAENITVRLYRRDFGGKATLLDEKKTAAQGVYSLAYPRDKTAAVEVRAVGAAGGEIALSTTFFPDEQTTTANFIAPAEVKPLEPEFARLNADLTREIGAFDKLANAREDAGQRDLTMLNRTTGWDARVLALASNAARLAADNDLKLSPQTAYALLRAGLPADKSALAQASPDAIRRALEASRQAGIVAMTDDQIKAATTQFTRAATDVVLNTVPPGATSSYKRLLESSGVTASALQKFTPVLLQHHGDGADLWTKAKEAGVDDADIRALQQHGKLAYLTTNNAPLLDKLRVAGVTTPDALVTSDFDRADTWKAQIRALHANDAELQKLIPAAYAGKTLDERLDAYSQDMARKVRLSYPTQVVSRMIARDGGDALKLGATRQNTRKFLDAAADKGFKFGSTPVETFLRDNPGILAADGVAETRQSLKILQRVYQMTPSDESMQTLLKLGFTSASQIAKIPREEFLARYTPQFRTPGEARLVYDKAVQIDAVTYNLFSIARQMDSAPPMTATAPSEETKKAAKEALVKQFPTMESLFGSMDFGECEHCQSVLSPAAYFVDLLQFIDPDALTWENFLAEWRRTHNGQEFTAKFKKPYDALIARRPDLPHIQLTCENTNTTLPYIDIVNEILEFYVAKNQLQPAAAKDTGGATSAELIAEPQYILSDAYDALIAARYPLGLPFDLWIETVRRFADHFEIPLWRILDVFRPGDELFAAGRIYDRAAVYAESLGLTPAEWGLFTDPNALATWFKLYGFDHAATATQVAVDASGQRIDLNSAKALSRRLGVSYRQLIDLLRTNFVNPKLQSLVTLEKSRLSVKDALFHEKHKGLLAQAEATLSTDDRQKRDEVLAFEARLDETSAAYPGFNARQWFSNSVAAHAFDDVLILADPDSGSNFDLTTLRYANGNAADGIAFLRINLFVRLWRKLGWSMAEVDRALSAFIPGNTPFDAAHLAQSPLKTALIYLAHLTQLEQTLPVGKNARLKLLTFWSALDSGAPGSLYAQLFLTRSMLRRDASFDDARGLYLTAANVFLKDHLSGVRAAIGLTADEIAAIVTRAGQAMATAPLSMDNVSLLYRHQLLARALKLSIRDLLALIDVSGVDPFLPVGAAPVADAAGDVVLSGTMRFVELARQVRDARLKVEDLDYLLRHLFDPNGPYALVTGGMPPMILTLSDGIRAIRAENAVPVDPGSISDDALRQKLGLVLPADVVERFLAMLNGSVEVTVTRGGVAPADKLNPATFADEPSIRNVRYNAARQEQSLTFRGVLFDPQKAALQAAFPSPVLASLLIDVQAQGQAFFDKHLRKQPPNVRPIAGFLDAADFDLLFAAAPPPPPGADEQTKQRLAQERIRQQKTRLAVAFLPYLQRKLVGAFVVQTLAAQTTTDVALTEALVSEKQIVGGAAPLLDAFTATDQSGVSASFFASNDATGAALASGVIDDATTDVPLAPAATRSARMEGYLRVPATGAYRFFVSLGKAAAEAELRFDHMASPLLQATAAIDGAEASEFTELKAGVPYSFTLELRKLGTGKARMQVQGETLPKDRLSQLTLYAQSAVDGGARAALLLDKIVRILRTLSLTEREVRYFTAHAADFAALDLSKFPTKGNVPAATARTLFSQLLRLIAYARLRGDLSGGTDELISVFEASAVSIDAAYPLLASLTRREEARIRETAERIFAAPRFVDEIDLQRLWEALQMVERFGVPLAAIAGARGVAPAQATGWITIVNPVATAQQRFGIARDLKETLRAQFDAETWQQIAQPIFDKLRRAQRDALAAHVMHKHGFARIEQLYEYFLIDPAMEPVVLTSRIRLASASVQLFIGRCLLNLEKDVHPSVIDSVQWEWMKRYRVWEANRKIFLFPENWLEPEFRDDRTHLYTELESKLLQGDVSRDQVNEAFYTYLQKLEEIHRLEIVAMHCENDANPAKNKLHVFARTYNASPKYFYRRYEHGMWTAWEPVTADVEGEHLAPIVWRDRLYLFWITFRDRANPEAKPTGTEKPANLDLNGLVSKISAVVANKIIEAHLHWSEFVNGAWSTQQSTFANGFTASVPFNFDHSSVFVHASLDDDAEDPGVRIHLTTFNQAYYLTSPMAPPQRVTAEGPPAMPYAAVSASASRYAATAPLKVTMKTKITTEDGKAPVTEQGTLPILNQQRRFTLVPIDNEIVLGTPEFASLVAPVFYQDNVNTFFIEPSLTETTIEKWENFVQPPVERKPDWEDPRWFDEKFIEPDVPRWKLPRPTDPGDPIWRQPFLEGPAVNPRKDWLTHPATLMELGGELIGPQGRPESHAVRDFNVSTAAKGGGDITVVGAGGLSSNLLDNVKGKDFVRFDAGKFDAGKLGGGFSGGNFRG